MSDTAEQKAAMRALLEALESGLAGDHAPISWDAFDALPEDIQAKLMGMNQGRKREGVAKG